MIIHTNSRPIKTKPNAKVRALRASWEKFVAESSPKIPIKLEKNKPLSSSYQIPEGRGTRHIPSINTNNHSTSLKETPMYTGENVLGITIMHKSCLQPIFSKKEAVEVAQMRRG